MKEVRYEIEVIEDNCTGCYLCEQICPTLAITLEGPKSSAIAVVDNSKCIACFRCIDICDDDALLAPERAEPIFVGTDVKLVDPAAIAALCQQAKIHPSTVACNCSSTTAKEVAAAILLGAHTMEAIALATGVQSGCQLYCFAPTHRLLTTFLGAPPKPPSKNKFYPTSYVLHDIAESVAVKYPKFHIGDDRDAISARLDRLSQPKT
jgi:ferredoxin/bacterioferritin-associated ferredoxin